MKIPDVKYFLRKALKTSIDYLVVLLIFLVFLYTFVAITGGKFTGWFPVYSIVNFIILFFILYSDYKQLAAKEKKPQYGLKSYPIKGLYLGIVGFIPMVVVFFILLMINIQDEALAKLMNLFADGVLGPVYFIVQAGGGTVVAYAAAILAVPAIVTLGYLAGYYDFSIRGGLGKKKETVSKVDKAFEPSPWNPTVTATEKTKKKKRKEREI